MATLDWSQCAAVESIPGKRSGAWVFRGTRTPVSTVFENLEDMSIDELIEEFGVTREQVQAVLEFAAQSTEAPAAASLMLVLFDNGTPRTLARYLIDRHAVTEARARGWEELENGELLAEAEAAGFEVLVTTDRNLPLSAKPEGPENRNRGFGKRTLEPDEAARREDRGCRERRCTGQLYRGRDSFRVAVSKRVSEATSPQGPPIAGLTCFISEFHNGGHEIRLRPLLRPTTRPGPAARRAEAVRVLKHFRGQGAIRREG